MIVTGRHNSDWGGVSVVRKCDIPQGHVKVHYLKERCNSHREVNGRLGVAIVVRKCNSL